MRNGCFTDPKSGKFYIFGGGTSVSFSNEMWVFDIEQLTVTCTQWSLVAQSGSVPPAMSGFAYTTYSVSEKLKFVVTKGLGLMKQTNDVFM